MELEIREDETTAVVCPRGDIIAVVVPDIRTKLRDLLGSGIRRLVVDLSQTYMIDSVGIGLLLAAYNSVHAAGGDFSVINASYDILDLLRTLRLHQHFSVSGVPCGSVA